MYLIIFFCRFSLIFDLYENRITRKYYFVNFCEALTQTRIYIKTRFSRELDTISRDEWKLRVSLSLSNAHTATHLKQNSDTEIHEWLGEIYHALPSVIDRHGCDSQVRSLWAKGNFLAWKHVVLTINVRKVMQKIEIYREREAIRVFCNYKWNFYTDNYTERRSQFQRCSLIVHC